MNPYCDYCLTHPDDAYNTPYHNTQYGFPISNDNLLFERLVFEINQAGLSWITILKKAEAFRLAYANFDLPTVAAFTSADVTRLMQDPTIIRNRLKIEAAITNAQTILTLQREHGSFKSWLDSHQELDHTGWTKLFKATFRFTGGEIVREFLLSTGYLQGAHSPDCPTYADVAAQNPAWMRSAK